VPLIGYAGANSAMRLECGSVLHGGDEADDKTLCQECNQMACPSSRLRGFSHNKATLRPHPTEPVPDVTLPIFRASLSHCRRRISPGEDYVLIASVLSLA